MLSAHTDPDFCRIGNLKVSQLLGLVVSSVQLKMLAIISEVSFDSPDLAIRCLWELMSRTTLDARVISQFTVART